MRGAVMHNNAPSATCRALSTMVRGGARQPYIAVATVLEFGMENATQFSCQTPSISAAPLITTPCYE